MIQLNISIKLDINFKQRIGNATRFSRVCLCDLSLQKQSLVNNFLKYMQTQFSFLILAKKKKHTSCQLSVNLNFHPVKLSHTDA